MTMFNGKSHYQWPFNSYVKLLEGKSASSIDAKQLLWLFRNKSPERIYIWSSDDHLLIVALVESFDQLCFLTSLTLYD